jgi:tetratricopeptide (TPR) repeat protein
MLKQFFASAGTAGAGEAKLAEPNKLGAKLLVAAEWLTLAAVLIIPLFFLPFTSQALEFPKQIVLLVLTTLIVLAWTGSVLAEKQITLRRTVANAAVAILLVATAVSAFMSHAKYVSIVGDYGQEYQSLITALLFAMFFFVVVNLPHKKIFTERVLFVFIVAAGIASLHAALLYSGVRVLPFITNTTFNFVGSTVGLGLLAATAVVATATYFLIDDVGGKPLAKRIAAGFFGLCSLVIVMAINFWPLWTVVIVSLVAVLVYALVRPNAIRRITWLAVPMGVLVVAALFLFINIPFPVRPPIEIFPTLKQSFNISVATLRSNPVFGSGPGTFSQDFALSHDQALNKSSLWYLNFDRASSYLMTLLATVGFAGLIGWLAIVAIGLWKATAYLAFNKNKDETNWPLVICLTAVFLASALGGILYGMSIVPMFIFWLTFTLLIRTVSAETVNLRFSQSPRTALGMTFFFVIVIILALSGWFVTGTKIYADALTVRAMNRTIPKEIDTVVSELTRAATMNGQSDAIWRDLAQAYLTKIQVVINDQTMDATTRGADVRSYTVSAVRAAQMATVLSPNEVADWNMLGGFFEAISAYDNTAPAAALDAYKHASDLEPASPVHHLDMGRVHLANADRAASDASAAKDDTAKAAAQKTMNDELASAQTEFNKALDLKSDYAPASYQLALVYARLGKTSDAIKKLEDLYTTNPNDAGLVFELGILYYQSGDKDKSQAAFSRAVAISPDFANARWFLATVYEDKKQYDDAIAQIQAILKNDPKNDTVLKRLDTLNAEKSGTPPPAGTTTTPLPQEPAPSTP